jgi:hypothetical protein
MTGERDVRRGASRCQIRGGCCRDFLALACRRLVPESLPGGVSLAAVGWARQCPEGSPLAGPRPMEVARWAAVSAKRIGCPGRRPGVQPAERGHCHPPDTRHVTVLRRVGAIALRYGLAGAAAPGSSCRAAGRRVAWPGSLFSMSQACDGLWKGMPGCGLRRRRNGQARWAARREPRLRVPAGAVTSCPRRW